uniref:2-phospho-L-lactate guanylyltransferase n=1 Tax=Lygus hesperus TaxID=30085 RepID=A0A0A9ZA98_LYGHE
MHTITVVTITLQITDSYKILHTTDDNDNSNHNCENKGMAKLGEDVCKAVLKDVKACLGSRVTRVKIKSTNSRKSHHVHDRCTKTVPSEEYTATSRANSSDEHRGEEPAGHHSHHWTDKHDDIYDQNTQPTADNEHVDDGK